MEGGTAEGLSFRDREQVLGEGGVGEGGLLAIFFAEDKHIGILGFGLGNLESFDANSFLFI